MDNIMFGDVFDSNGFNMVWICCAMEDEDRKNKTFTFTHKMGKMKQNVTTSGDYKEKDKWDGIKCKIKVNPTLNQEKLD